MRSNRIAADKSHRVIVAEDSQIDFAAGNFFLRISNFSNNRFFQALDKNLISKEEYYK